MDENPPQAVVATLVGEAMSMLAEMGVSAQVLGEFAIRYPAKVAATLGSKPPQDEPTDLEKVVFEQVTRALRVEKGLRVTDPGDRGKQRINVLINGKRTTLSISAALVKKAGLLTGSRSAGRQLIEQLAEQAPVDTPRSTWTEQALHARLLFLASSPFPGPQH